MTTKQQRTAYNLTKLAKANDIRWGSCGEQFEWMWEIAKDAGISAIDAKTYVDDLDQFVFIPTNEWDEADEEFRSCVAYGIEDSKRAYRVLVKRYYLKAMRHGIA